MLLLVLWFVGCIYGLTTDCKNLANMVFLVGAGVIVVSWIVGLGGIATVVMIALTGIVWINDLKDLASLPGPTPRF